MPPVPPPCLRRFRPEDTYAERLRLQGQVVHHRVPTVHSSLQV